MIDRLLVENLSLARGDRVLFKALTFRLGAGEAAALTGSNGAGKTTLLRAIAGLVRPASGRVRFCGPSGEMEPDEGRGPVLHLLGHQDGLKNGRTARDELGFQAAFGGASPEAIEGAVAALDLGRLLGLEVRKLSAGQRRRLALARMVAAPRPLWLLDEPLSPLDAVYRARFGQLMAAHLAGGGLILAAVHDPLPIPAKSVEIVA